VQGGQLSLLGNGDPSLEPGWGSLQHMQLDASAWVEYRPSWVQGQQALMDALCTSTTWHQQRREMYDREVAVPRLVANLPDDGPGHPLLEQMRSALAARYDMEFPRTGLALYRDGNDSVAWHGDTIARDLPAAVVATVSLGQPRRFLLRPAGGGASRAFRLGWGDLIVMGGSCQRTWRHCIPKLAHADPRLVLMFRPIWIAPPGSVPPRGS
jgi:alkylated DNA repair dioxygenase AlkB